MAGFAYADTPFTGPSIIVTTDGHKQLARVYAAELSDLLYRQRESALPAFLSASDAVAKALEIESGPVILVDSADNIGGGTSGDGTDALAALLAHDVREAAIVLADYDAVDLCWRAGPGADLSLNVGGKADSWHGPPVRVTGNVRALSDGEFECELADNHFASFYGNTVQMGPLRLAARARRQHPADRAQDPAAGPGAIAPHRHYPRSARHDRGQVSGGLSRRLRAYRLRHD